MTDPRSTLADIADALSRQRDAIERVNLPPFETPLTGASVHLSQAIYLIRRARDGAPATINFGNEKGR